MLLGGDDAAGLLRRAQNQLGVERLDRVHINDADGHALGGHRLARLERKLHHHAGGDDGDVLAVCKGGALIQLEAVALDLVGDGLDGGAAKAQIGRAVVVQQRLDGELHLVAVAGAEHLHAGNDAHERQILDALMRRAVLADGQAAVRADDLDVQVGIGDGIAHLLPCSAGGKDGEGVGEGLEAAGGKAGGDAGHVALGNAHIKEALGIFGRKALGHGCVGEVGVEHDQLGILLRQLDQRFAVGGAGGNLSCHITCPPVLLILLRLRPWPAHTARRSAPCRASRRCSP